VGSAWLHRNGRSTWEFKPEGCYGDLIHRTSKGTVYAIILGKSCDKPFWIGRLGKSSGGSDVWLTCERELRARSIEFENGGDYLFPVAKKRG